MIPRRVLPLSLFYLTAGTLHFLRPRVYEAIMPAALRLPLQALLIASAWRVAAQRR